VYRPRDFWILALLSTVLLLAPLRSGDLAGYDDAQYAHIAKDMVKSGEWLDVRTSGNLAFQNPPLFEWMQAALFCIFGVSDTAARAPSALCGLGVILLVFWLARRLTGDSFTALLAMFVMVTSLYFLKYAARAMTDVPFVLFFLCAMCAWILAEDQPRWYLATGFLIGAATMTRSLMGLSLPAIFLLDGWVGGRRPPWRYIAPALAIAFLPLAAWYGRILYLYRDLFLAKHSTWLSEEVLGPLSPAWRRYTGAFEYAWMLAKSYWPWLPAMLAGAVLVVRRRDSRFYLLLVWPAVVFALCAVTRSRVLRYMLPSYPAFAVLAAVALAKFVPDRYLHKGLRIATALLGAAVAFVAVFPRTHLEAGEIRPLAVASTAATPPGQRVLFYDNGQRRYDEVNQLEWYGDRFLIWPADRAELEQALLQPPAPVFVLDEETYRTMVDSRVAHSVLARSGHLICIRVCGENRCKAGS
jgi:4-amino-4-deoxy-L-arabinose transferase-like glycosyltransferase